MLLTATKKDRAAITFEKSASFPSEEPQVTIKNDTISS